MKSTNIIYFTDNEKIVFDIEELLISNNINFKSKCLKDIEFVSNEIKENKVDVIIADINLNNFQIIDLLDFLNDKPIRKNIPCIIISEDNNNANIANCLKKGAYDYINFSEMFRLPYVLKNISEKNKKDSENEHCEEKFKKLSNINPLGVLIYQDLTWVYTNKKGEEISEYKSEELYRMKIWEGIHPAYKTILLNRAQKRLSGKIVVPENIELKIKTKTGKEKWVFITGKLINYKSKPAGLIFVNDISNRKLIEEKYKNIIEFAPIGFYQTTRDGDFIIFNKEFANILGYCDVKELRSKKISDFYYTPSEREKLIVKYDIDPNPTVKNVEIKFRKRDGSPIWILMTAKAIKDDNRETLFYDGFIIDITERKKRKTL